MHTEQCAEKTRNKQCDRHDRDHNGDGTDDIGTHALYRNGGAQKDIPVLCVHLFGIVDHVDAQGFALADNRCGGAVQRREDFLAVYVISHARDVALFAVGNHIAGLINDRDANVLADLFYGALRGRVIVFADIRYRDNPLFCFRVMVIARDGNPSRKENQHGQCSKRNIEPDIFSFHSNIYPTPRMVRICAAEPSSRRRTCMMCRSSVRVSP